MQFVQRSTARTEIAELPVPVTALQRQELKTELVVSLVALSA